MSRSTPITEVMAPVGGEESSVEPPLAADAAPGESSLVEALRCYLNNSPEQAAKSTSS